MFIYVRQHGLGRVRATFNGLESVLGFERAHIHTHTITYTYTHIYIYIYIYIYIIYIYIYIEAESQTEGWTEVLICMKSQIEKP